MNFKRRIFPILFIKTIHPLRYLISRAFFLCIILLFGFTNLNSQTKQESSKIWVGTWATAPQLVEPNNMPPSPGLTNNTIRQIVRVSIGGDSLRVRFSNEFSKNPVTMKEVQIAFSAGNSAIIVSSEKTLKFKGKSDITINPESIILSDPIAFNLKPRMDVAITISFGQTSPDVTGHPGSRTTSFILPGNKVSEAEFSDAVQTDHWYVINGIDVKASESAASIAILGNSITDGRGSGTNKQNRWPDILADRLLKNPATEQIGVLNMGIGGNCVLRGGLGPTALNRFERDIINQHGVRWLIIMEGVNDIGGTRSSEASTKVAEGLIEAYGKMIDEAHVKGIKVYGATITPINKSFYYTDYHEEARNVVNEWIRTSGRFDAVIDFDKAMGDPNDNTTLLQEAQTGDFLHPNELGYQIMGNSIDLKLFK